MNAIKDPPPFRFPGSREELAEIGIHEDPVIFAAADKMFKVQWIDTTSGREFAYEIQARSYADAAWRVARYMFDTVHPDNRELMDVIRLS